MLEMTFKEREDELIKRRELKRKVILTKIFIFITGRI